MQTFKLERSNEFFTSHAGLCAVGQAINNHTQLNKSLRDIPLRHGIPNMELIRSFVGLLTLGKSDFDAIEPFRRDQFFKKSLGIKQMPSASRLRQRFDQDARAIIPYIDQGIADFLSSSKAPVSALSCGYVALDIDPFPMDNSNTKKEGVSRTYAGCDGYCAMGAYLGQEGWAIGMELREGKIHGQKEFGHVLDRVLPTAKKLSGERSVLCRLDGAFDAVDNRIQLSQAGVDYLIRWNKRSMTAEKMFEWVESNADKLDIEWEQPRFGKRVAVFSQKLTDEYKLDGEEQTNTYRRVTRLTERKSDKHGQMLIEPELELDGWVTSLKEDQFDDKSIIDLYKDHATSEQFHSEIKTDLGLERLPSGKFDTNDLVLILGALAYNILRWIGQTGLTGKLSPIRHSARRRRIRTVIQEVMYRAAKFVSSGRQLSLKFSHHCTSFLSIEHIYTKLLGSPDTG